MIEQTLINSIINILDNVKAVKEVMSALEDGAPSKYPAVVYAKDSAENSMATNAENLKVFTFKLWVLINPVGTTNTKVAREIMPNVVDQISAAFDKAWHGGRIEGQNVTFILSSGRQGKSDENKSVVIWEELNLTVKLLVSV